MFFQGLQLLFHSNFFQINTCLTSRSSIKLSTTSISLSFGIYVSYSSVICLLFYRLPQTIIQVQFFYVQQSKNTSIMSSKCESFQNPLKVLDIISFRCNYFNLTGIRYYKHILHYMQVHTVSKYAFGMLLLKIGSLCDQFKHEIIRYRWTLVMVRYIRCIT